ncbi:NAD(P)-binding domain-containing protein [Zunongwangia sp. F363]|uniref:NAD(P)-binding domain-containing protein n=1 Tax=Autumnicola tepida TaxID=3075595 RepID=A0ABU3CEP8_9FLAO|nr:NAD(P)-binding domain-containing protein [Zunongwangia sp. F363]MDT0644827.1 NAD(P)-binding domain-containing protein [Zunongwangia sp. F363]
MKIGIIGTGNMGRVVGLALASVGHEVFFGSRDVKKAKLVSRYDKTTLFGTNQRAAEFGDIIYYTPRDIHPGDVLEDVSVLEGKIVLESNNGNLNDQLKAEEIEISRAQILQSQIPEAYIVKGFNTITQEIFEYSGRGLKELEVTCFVASDNRNAAKEVMKLAEDLGFNAEYCGELFQALLLEHLGSLYRIMLRRKATPWLALSLKEIKATGQLRFGGRTPSSLHTQGSFLK